MELIVISKSKLKIMLDERDMLEYHINDNTNCAEPSARQAIREILDRARDEVGFETEGSELFVQLYTSRHGGCELFVSKSSLPPLLSRTRDDGKGERADSRQKYFTSEEATMRNHEIDEGDKRRADKEKDRESARADENGKKHAPSRLAFSFPSVRELSSVCRILKGNGVRNKSSAYSDLEGRTYLILYNVGTSLYSRLDKLTFILEYGRRENPTALLGYIGECGREIRLNDAIEVLANF